MSDINPMNQPPLFEEDQVLTIENLLGIRNGFVLQLNRIPWYMVSERNRFAHYINCVDMLIKWVECRKPAYFKGVYNCDTDTFDIE